MAPKREIPGFYWDEEKGRYFKVENSKTAPSGAAWSSDSVKKRKLEVAAAAEESRRLALNKIRIKRSKVLNHPLMGGFVAREYGERIRDLHASSYVNGLTDNGHFRIMTHHRKPKKVCIKNMVVTREDHVTGYCGIHYWESTSPGFVVSGVISRNTVTGRIHNPHLPEILSSRRVPPFPPPFPPPPPRETCVGALLGMGQISDIKYNEKADLVLITSRENCDGQGFLIGYTLRPHLPPSDVKLTFDTHLQSSPTYLKKLGKSGVVPCGANTIHVDPWRSNYTCMVGTSVGLVMCHPRGSADLITPRAPKRRPIIPSAFRDVFAIDNQDENPHNVYFGGRPGALVLGDIRQGARMWDHIQIGCPITHLKAIGDHQVLVSGLRNMLSVFDTRFCKTLRSCYPAEPEDSEVATPILSIPGYQNAARLEIGLDFDKNTGTIAAAHDDGRMALYSVRSGRRLLCRAVDRIYQKAGPISAVQFSTFMGDNLPSLIVGTNDAFDVISFTSGMDDSDDDIFSPRSPSSSSLSLGFLSSTSSSSI
ncbi:hypothetical protein F5Y04DRAFT_262035 [Hypomontagnella monticulosa]|nr:hypothetical protein F5Y04DRAFT_262035 [Hypomontagnella monticulosa]